MLSDIHIPVEVDEQAFKFALQIIRYVEPDRVELLGDIADMHGLGTWAKPPSDEGKIQEEIDEVKFGLGRIRYAAGDAKITFIEGNHEDRMRRYLQDKGSKLFGLDVLRMDNLLDLQHYDITFNDGPYRLGGLWFLHGHEIKAGGVNPARMALQKLNDSVIFGHVHKFSIAHKHGMNGKNYFGYSNGCLTGYNPGYTTSPDWCQGFSIVDFTKSGLFQVQQVVIWRQKNKMMAIVDGEEHHMVESRARRKRSGI